MIALCSEHHRFADAGNYSTARLRILKQNPPATPPAGRLPWSAESIFIRFGGNYFITHKERLFSFRIDGRPVFSFSLLNDGYLAIDAAIYSRLNELVCEIEANDILPNLATVGDLTCSAGGQKIEITSRANDALLSLKFDRFKPDKLISSVRKRWPSKFSLALKLDKTEKVWGFIQKVLDDDGFCPNMTPIANVNSGTIPVRTLGKGITADFRRIGMDRPVMTGLDAGEGGLKFVYSHTQAEMLFFGSEHQTNVPHELS